MYIGLGTVVLILVIVFIIYLVRREPRTYVAAQLMSRLAQAPLRRWRSTGLRGSDADLLGRTLKVDRLSPRGV